MPKISADAHVIPRPYERLPDYAVAKARQALAEKLTAMSGMSSASANAISDAVVDPSDVRKTIGDTTNPNLEHIPVQGGTLLGVRTTVWARRVMPDPRNPRILPWRKHAFAVTPGSGSEDTRFRPLSEPQPLNPALPHLPELALNVESRDHLDWACTEASRHVLAENDWRESIRSQGVMAAVCLVPVTFRHDNNTDSATVLVSVDGSSRLTAEHAVLGVRSGDVPYDDADAKLRNHIRKLNEAYDRGDVDTTTAVMLRCERMPALILAGFNAHEKSDTTFAMAVKSLVALQHVDPPRPWGPGPENEALADGVLEELHHRGLITTVEKEYFGGTLTREEAEAAHMSSDPAYRTARLVHLFTSGDKDLKLAIRRAVTRQATRKNITATMMNDLATALILRAMSEDPARSDQVRRYMRAAFGKFVHHNRWKPELRSIDELVARSMEEVRHKMASGHERDTGPHSIDLAVRAAYPLIVSGRLNSDRGTANNDQPDRRVAGEVLDAMRHSVQGVSQLRQALKDFAEGKQIRAVDEDGNLKLSSDGTSYVTVNDIYLRSEFPAHGTTQAVRSGDTPADRFGRALAKAEEAVLALEEAVQSLGRVAGEDSVPLVDTRGLDPTIGKVWREKLSDMDDSLGFWVKTARKKAGSAAAADATYDYGSPAPDVGSEESIGEESWDEANTAAAD
jgi:hypothetical protein